MAAFLGGRREGGGRERMAREVGRGNGGGREVMMSLRGPESGEGRESGGSKEVGVGLPYIIEMFITCI